MYERSAIVLERYFEKLFSFNKDNNLKICFQNYENLLSGLDTYKEVITKEEKVLTEFDKIALEIEKIQKEQEKLCNSNFTQEDERNKIFNDLDGDPEEIEIKLRKIENTIDKNNERLKEIREEYIHALRIFEEKQKERKNCNKEKRVAEKDFLKNLQDAETESQGINSQDITRLQNFIDQEKEDIKTEIESIMIKNGKNEKIAFNKDVIKKAVEIRTDIANREAECYLQIYEKLNKLLQEANNDTIKLNKYKKTLRDVTVKLKFLNAEKEYIVSFLDNERMTAINGLKAHKQLMKEACSNFEKDIEQINNLYELLLRETTGKSTKKAYKELYNKTYLKDIEEKEKNFEEEKSNIKINIGAVINFNYWRIDGIKNIYHTFHDEITEKFEKDLSEYKIDDEEERIEEKENLEEKNDIEEKENFIKIEDEDKIDYIDNEEKDENENITDNVLPLKIYVDLEGKLQELINQNKENKMYENENENKTEKVKRKNTTKNNDKIKDKKEKKGILNKFFKN